MDYPSTLAPYPGFLRAANAVAIVIQSVRYDIQTGTAPNTPMHFSTFSPSETTKKKEKKKKQFHRLTPKKNTAACKFWGNRPLGFCKETIFRSIVCSKKG